MTASQAMWQKVSRLLAQEAYFEAERDKVMASYPTLNSKGMGQLIRNRRLEPWRGNTNIRRQKELEPNDLNEARGALLAGGKLEKGIRNTLEYLLEARISLSYQLRGCAWARRFNGVVPRKTSSYYLKHQAESFLREKDNESHAAATDSNGSGSVANGAFICGALMAGIRIWTYRGSVHPDLRLGKPWAVAGLQPEDFGHADDVALAKFWRWVVQQDTKDLSCHQKSLDFYNWSMSVVS